MSTTPDPIALPELPEPTFTTEDDDLFTVAQMRAYGQACVDAAHPIPTDMVLVPREVLDRFPEINPSNCDHEDACALNAWGVELVLSAETSAQSLNEPFGNSEQLASLEQRSRELFEAQAVPLASPWERQWEPTKQYWRGQAAALSAQPRDADSLLTEAECGVIETLLDLAYAAWSLADNGEDAGRESVTIERSDLAKLSEHLDTLEALPDDRPGYTMGEAAKARWALRRLLNVPPAAPQPRGVLAIPSQEQLIEWAVGWRGSDSREGLTGEDDMIERITYAIRAGLLATTPQDAAGVGGDWFGDVLASTGEVVPLTTPPPGVDVAALRQIAGELRDNAHHHQQEDREVGILADEQEAQFNTELAERIERALTGDAAAPGVGNG